MSATVGDCSECGGSQKLLVPLHGDKGGRLTCVACGIDWHAKTGRIRKLGRIVVKASKAYLAAGGKFGALDRLKLAASGFALFPWEEDALGADVGDITTELLEAAIRLTHPDRHPPERQESAKRVTEELLALKPFTFPAPAPTETPPTPPERNGSSNSHRVEDKKPLRLGYPCELCIDEIPYYYCVDCRAEWDRRQRAQAEREQAQRKAAYTRRARAPAS